MQSHWRAAFMFDAKGGDTEGLETGLREARGKFLAAALGHSVRLGVPLGSLNSGNLEGPHDVANWRPVDGAVEVSVANGQEGIIPDICRAMRPLLDRFAEPGSIEVMTGPMHHMVPVREGGVFLSLSFRRDPRTTVRQFRDWWHDQHAPLCIPILGEELLAYDQVHVEEAPSRKAAEALGVAFVAYDAYDNLTFASLKGYLESVSDLQGLARIGEDEVGRIDNTSRRHALMREIV